MRNTRSRKQNKIDWISCNNCGQCQWVYPYCSGINKKEITKINKWIKAVIKHHNHFSSACAVYSQQKHLVQTSYTVQDNPPNQCPVNLKQKTISHTPQSHKYQWHQQTKAQFGHHHKEVKLVTQKTHLSPEKSRYQTQTACQQTSKPPH